MMLSRWAFRRWGGSSFSDKLFTRRIEMAQLILSWTRVLATDARDFALSLNQRCGTGVHRVVAKMEIMRMRDCRTEHEARVGHSFEFDRRIGLVEYGQLTFVDRVGRAQATVHHCDPADPEAPRRLVGPALAGLEFDNEIVDARRCINRADR